jgi:hypothetical protein
VHQTRYFILRNQDAWLIKFDGQEFGPYKSKSEAMMFAIDAAQRLGERGKSPQVCLMGENGCFRPEWVYGRDSYPPSLS